MKKRVVHFHYPFGIACEVKYKKRSSTQDVYKVTCKKCLKHSRYLKTLEFQIQWDKEAEEVAEMIARCHHDPHMLKEAITYDVQVCTRCGAVRHRDVTYVKKPLTKWSEWEYDRYSTRKVDQEENQNENT